MWASHTPRHIVLCDDVRRTVELCRDSFMTHEYTLILLYVYLQFTDHSGLKMSSRKTAGRRGTTKKRAQRATSNVFAMFNQDQIQEFKEAFNMIDHNR